MTRGRLHDLYQFDKRIYSHREHQPLGWWLTTVPVAKLSVASGYTDYPAKSNSVETMEMLVMMFAMHEYSPFFPDTEMKLISAQRANSRKHYIFGVNDEH